MNSSASGWWRKTGDTLGAGHQRVPHRARVGVEALEDRQVPSQMVGNGPGLGVAAHVMMQRGGRIEPAAPHEIIRTGIAIKTPMFYELYTGRLDPGLNAREATARVTGRGLVLTGVMQGRINTKPTTDSEESYFAFGINRGSSKAIAPFPKEPNVIFDAVVVVNVETEGISASVTDLTKPRGTGTIDLSSGAVQVRGNVVQVVVPLDLLTPTATLPVRQWGVNLWPRTQPPPAGPETVASFVPENAMFRIAVPRGLGR